MAQDTSKVSSMLQKYPLRELLFSMAQGIIDSQRKLDAISLQALYRALDNPISNKSGQSANLLELGLVPNFYQFEKVVIKVSVEVRMSEETMTEKSVGFGIGYGGLPPSIPPASTPTVPPRMPF